MRRGRSHLPVRNVRYTGASATMMTSYVPGHTRRWHQHDIAATEGGTRGRKHAVCVCVWGSMDATAGQGLTECSPLFAGCGTCARSAARALHSPGGRDHGRQEARRPTACQLMILPVAALESSQTALCRNRFLRFPLAVPTAVRTWSPLFKLADYFAACNRDGIVDDAVAGAMVEWGSGEDRHQ